MTETYSVSGDFSSGVNIGQLQTEILADSSITTILLGITRDDDDLFIVFTAAISGAEKTALDALVAAHVPEDTSNVIPATGGLVRFLTIFNPVSPLYTNYSSVSSALWHKIRYANFNNGRVVFSSNIIDTGLDIQIWDATNSVQLGFYSSTVSENTIFNIITPTTDIDMAIRVKKASVGGTSPILVSIVVEFIN